MEHFTDFTLYIYIYIKQLLILIGPKLSYNFQIGVVAYIKVVLTFT